MQEAAPLPRNMYVEGWLKNIDNIVHKKGKMMIYGYEAMGIYTFKIC